MKKYTILYWLEVILQCSDKTHKTSRNEKAIGRRPIERELINIGGYVWCDPV